MKNAKKNTRGKWQAGVALAEFAVALPLLMLLLIGVIEIGRFVYFSIMLGNAAHAGAQYGTKNSGDGAGMIAVAKNDAQPIASLINVQTGSYCYCWDGTSTPPSNPQSPCTSVLACAAGSHQLNYVTVTVSGTFTSLFNYPGLPRTFTLTRTAAMQAF